MKRMTLAAAPLLVAALAVFMAAPASAFVNPVVDFGTGYAVEGTRAVDNHISTSGDNLLIVGHVVAFNDPFADLDPNDPAMEYTYVYRDLVSTGTTVAGSGLTAVYTTVYTGGILEVYADPSMDSDFANPATFSNGTMILQASLSGFTLTTLGLNCSGNQAASFTFTGGSLFSRVPGWGGVAPGLFSVCSSLVPSAQQAQGYCGLSDTKLDIDPGTPVEERTWGQLKQGID